jgi:hypothetical protein
MTRLTAVSAHEKALNLFLAWECCSKHEMRYDTYFPVIEGRYIYATDTKRCVRIEANSCLPLLVSEDVLVGRAIKFPSVESIIKQYKWDNGEWMPLSPIARRVTLECGDYDGIDGTISHYDEIAVGQAVVNRELIWPFSLMPGAVAHVRPDRKCVLIKWPTGCGVVMAINPKMADGEK